MDVLAGHMSIIQRAHTLPGLLARNADETRAFTQHMRDIQHTVTDSVLVGQLMDLDLEDEDADNAHWSKDEWYCLACIGDLFRQRLMPWWREERRRCELYISVIGGSNSPSIFIRRHAPSGRLLVRLPANQDPSTH